MTFEWSEGAWTPCIGIPPEDRGFRYGMHLFETVAVRSGKPQFLEAHLGLLFQSASQAGFRAPADALEALRATLPIEALFANSPTDGLLRIFWTAGPGGPLEPPTEGKILLLSETCSLPSSAGVIAEAADGGALHPIGGGWKTGNYWGNIRIAGDAIARGADASLVFSPDNRWLGGAFANGFLHDGNKWFTPPSGDGVRAGVVRAAAIRLLGAEERVLRRADLRAAHSLFLTNSRILAASVLRFEKMSFATSPDVESLFSKLLRADDSLFAKAAGLCVV